MNRKHFIINIFSGILFLAIISCSNRQSQVLVQLPIYYNQPSLDSIQSDAVYKYMQHFPNRSEIAIGLIKGKSEQFFGIRRQNDSLVYVENRKMAFEIGSITKTFTATMLAKLVYEGLIDLNEPVSNILPCKLKQDEVNGQRVTILQLANHTSGFPKEPDINLNMHIPASPYKNYDKSKLYDFLSNRLILQHIPGEKREYSNLGGGLLGHLIELITGKSYELYLQESICEPLKMNRTFVTIDSQRKEYIVPGRSPYGKIVPNWELGILVGGGGIKSTAEDMVKYLHAQMTDTTFFLLTQMPTMQYSEHNTAGLGWAWYNHEKYKFVDATGGTGGYSCIVIFERSTQTAIVLLTNVSAFLASKGDYISKLGIELHNSIFYGKENGLN
ncbi:MAG: serine hydrolase domain-containing protein [Bacteroidota bacterium]